MFYTIFRRLFFVLSQQYICYLHDHIMMDKTTSKISDPHKILLAESLSLVAEAGSLLGKLMGPLSSQIYKQINHP